MTKKPEAQEVMATVANEAIEKSQEFFAKTTSSSEKLVEGLIEYNAAVFKGGEVIAKKAYDQYLANVAAAFDNMKALNKATDFAEFYKVSTKNAATSYETLTAQTKELSELGTKIGKETAENAKVLYSKNFAAV